MAYLVLARKYRPTDFESFVGQDVIAETLRNAIKLDRVAHAYLFCGPRGVGKTSMARVFAKALNCEKGPTIDPCGKCERCKAIASGQDVDVIEIDGASNRGIDEVRDIRQNARYAASHSRFKIYYIDEVHMLTEPAFNALLKTLEEPPPHVKFIFATTAATKLPETILSRVQRFDFRRISSPNISKKLAEICKKEKLKVPDDVLALVSKRARGSMRDSLSLLDQIISFCGEQPDVEAVSGLLGTLGDDELARLIGLVRARDSSGLLKMADDLLRRGMDVGELLDQFLSYVRDLLVAKTCGPDPDLLDRPAESAAAVAAVARDLAPDHLLYIAEVLNSARRRAREAQDDRIILEMTLLKLGQADGLAPLGELLERLLALEDAVAAGQPVGAPSAPPRFAPVAPPPRPAGPVRPAPAAAVPPLAVREEPPEAAVEEDFEAPAAAPVAVDDLDGFWRQFTAKVSEGKGLGLLSYLSGARFSRVAAGEAVIALPADRPRARAELEKPDVRRELQTVLAQLVGRPMALRFTHASGEAPRPAVAPVADTTDPKIIQARDKFKGEFLSHG